MKPKETHLNAAFVGLAILASSAVVGAGATYASSSSDAPAAAAATTPTDTVPPSDPAAGADDEAQITECSVAFEIGSDEFAQDFDSLSPDDQKAAVDQMTKAAGEVKQLLDEAGAAYTLEADPVTGVEWPMPDENDPAAEAAIDGWTSEIYEVDGGTMTIDEGPEGFQDYFDSLDAEEQAALIEQSSNEAAALAKEMDEQGVEYTMEPDEVTGVEWPVPNFSGSVVAGSSTGDDEFVTMDVVSDADFAEMFNSLSAEEQTAMVEEMTADAAKIADQLDTQGVTYTLDVDPITGVSWPIPEGDGGEIVIGDTDIIDGEVSCDDLALDGGTLAESSVPVAEPAQ